MAGSFIGSGLNLVTVCRIIHFMVQLITLNEGSYYDSSHCDDQSQTRYS
jgi:hypothetical protein